MANLPVLATGCTSAGVQLHLLSKPVIARVQQSHLTLPGLLQQQSSWQPTCLAQQECCEGQHPARAQPRLMYTHLHFRVQGVKSPKKPCTCSAMPCTQALTRTRALKRRVDDLRRERLVFNDLLRKLGASCDGARTSALQSLKHIHHANLARDRVCRSALA